MLKFSHSEILLFSIMLFVASVATMRTAAAAEIPVSLQPPVTQTTLLKLHAKGVQIYECTASKEDPNRFEWAFKAPQAELFDATGKQAGKHFAGPTWQAGDGSSVVGEVKAKENSPEPAAIPWLLLSAKATSGIGMFSHVQSIQRLATHGGKAPSDGCNKPQFAQQLRVPYEADYVFSGEKR